MKNKIHITMRRIANNVFSNISSNRSRRRTITKFADKIGLVNFGSVNQRSDEHRIIRGFTVSSTHQDNCYCVGTINNYDITIVDRSDIVVQTDGSTVVYDWLVYAFDLHTKQDLPHLFIGAHDNKPKPYESLFGTFPVLREIELGTFEDYSDGFTSRYNISSQPSLSIAVEKLFPADIANIIGNHFWPLSAEHHEGVLYIYSDKLKITPSLMDVMLENGLWLANHLDRQAELV